MRNHLLVLKVLKYNGFSFSTSLTNRLAFKKRTIL